MHTEPSAPIGAITPLAAVPPRPKLTFDASGIGAPHGHTVAKPAALASTIVTFSATADAVGRRLLRALPSTLDGHTANQELRTSAPPA